MRQQKGRATLNPKRTHGDSGAPQAGRGGKKKKPVRSGGTREQRTMEETRELHNLVPACKRKKKSTGMAREKHRETGPTIQTERVTNHEAGTPDTLHHGQKQGKEAGHLKKPHGKAQQRDAGWARRGKITPSEARKRDRHLASFNVTQLKDSVSAPICRYNKDR